MPRRTSSNDASGLSDQVVDSAVQPTNAASNVIHAHSIGATATSVASSSASATTQKSITAATVQVRSKKPPSSRPSASTQTNTTTAEATSFMRGGIARTLDH